MAAVVLDHVTVTASDLAASLAFYDAALGALGLVRIAEHLDEEEEDADIEVAAWGAPAGRPLLWLVGGASASRGMHVRFIADSRIEVETFFRDGVATGGRAHAAPRRWVLYRRGEYGATLADPDGNLVEAVAPE